MDSSHLGKVAGFPETEALPLHKFGLLNKHEYPFSISYFSRSCAMAQAGFPHRHDFYQILYLESGQAVQFVDFEPYLLNTPCCFFLTPGQVHYWDIQEAPEGQSLLFTEDFLVVPETPYSGIYDIELFHSATRGPEVLVAPEQRAYIKNILENLNMEYCLDEENSVSVLRSYLHILITQLQRLSSKQGEIHEPRDRRIVRRFKQLVNENFHRQHQPQSYAEQMGISTGHLGDVTRAVTGLSPGQMIRNEISLEAKRLLAHTEWTSAEIGYRLNFEDPSYFGRFFKRETGLPPGLFRDQIREKYQFSGN